MRSNLNIGIIKTMLHDIGINQNLIKRGVDS